MANTFAYQDESNDFRSSQTFGATVSITGPLTVSTWGGSTTVVIPSITAVSYSANVGTISYITPTDGTNVGEGKYVVMTPAGPKALVLEDL